MKVVAAF